MAINWNKVGEAQRALIELQKKGADTLDLARRLEGEPQDAERILFEANRALVRLSRSSVTMPGINRFGTTAGPLTRAQRLFVDHLVGIGISDPNGDRGDQMNSIADRLKEIV